MEVKHYLRNQKNNLTHGKKKLRERRGRKKIRKKEDSIIIEYEVIEQLISTEKQTTQFNPPMQKDIFSLDNLSEFFGYEYQQSSLLKSLHDGYDALEFPHTLDDPVKECVYDEADLEYEVEDILDSKVENQIRKYLVKWKDFPESNTWEPTFNLRKCWSIVTQYIHSLPQESQFEELKDQFHNQGLVHVPHFGLETWEVEKCELEIKKEFNKQLDIVKGLDLSMEKTNDEFDSFKMIGKGRYSILVPESNDLFKYPFLYQDAKWMPFINSILGNNCKRVEIGAILSFPNSETQNWHQDGPHRDTTNHKKAHRVNVFIPLLDMKKKHGPTEFKPSTHHLGEENAETENVIPCPKRGEVIIFDHRLQNRGLENKSQKPRLILYLVYEKDDFVNGFFV